MKLYRRQGDAAEMAILELVEAGSNSQETTTAEPAASKTEPVTEVKTESEPAS